MQAGIVVLPRAAKYEPQKWMAYARCRDAEVDPDLFYPERGGASTAEPAKRVCASCLVQNRCLKFALDNGEELGIWGGTSEAERRKIRHERNRPSHTESHHGRGRPDRRTPTSTCAKVDDRHLG